MIHRDVVVFLELQELFLENDSEEGEGNPIGVVVENEFTNPILMLQSAPP